MHTFLCKPRNPGRQQSPMKLVHVNVLEKQQLNKLKYFWWSLHSLSSRKHSGSFSLGWLHWPAATTTSTKPTGQHSEQCSFNVFCFFFIVLFSFDAGHLVEVVDSRGNVKCSGEICIIISGIQHACKESKRYGLCFPDHSYIWCVLVCCCVVTTRSSCQWATDCLVGAVGSPCSSTKASQFDYSCFFFVFPHVVNIAL